MKAYLSHSTIAGRAGLVFLLGLFCLVILCLASCSTVTTTTTAPDGTVTRTETRGVDPAGAALAQQALAAYQASQHHVLAEK